MYEYKFVKIELSIFFKEPEQDYRMVIEEHARQGWRLNQIFSPPLTGHGACTFYELIFERKL